MILVKPQLLRLILDPPLGSLNSHKTKKEPCKTRFLFLAENVGLLSNPNLIELKKLHELAMEIEQSQSQKKITKY